MFTKQVLPCYHEVVKSLDQVGTVTNSGVTQGAEAGFRLSIPLVYRETVIDRDVLKEFTCHCASIDDYTSVTVSRVRQSVGDCGLSGDSTGGITIIVMDIGVGNSKIFTTSALGTLGPSLT